MGSAIEINDTLQLTKEQGFPENLNFEIHKKKPFIAKDFTGKEFEFKNKLGIRIYKSPPVRNFLVENRNGKWLYWGLIHIIEVNHDYKANTTSGKFIITYIYSPQEMRTAYTLIDRRPENSYLEDD